MNRGSRCEPLPESAALDDPRVCEHKVHNRPSKIPKKFLHTDLRKYTIHFVCCCGDAFLNLDLVTIYILSYVLFTSDPETSLLVLDGLQGMVPFQPF